MSPDVNGSTSQNIGKSARKQLFLNKTELVQWLTNQGVPATMCWLERGGGKKLPKCHFGNKIRFKVSEIENYLANYPITNA